MNSAPMIRFVAVFQPLPLSSTDALATTKPVVVFIKDQSADGDRYSFGSFESDDDQGQGLSGFPAASIGRRSDINYSTNDLHHANTSRLFIVPFH